jgi:hypothetical protein
MVGHHAAGVFGARRGGFLSSPQDQASNRLKYHADKPSGSTQPKARIRVLECGRLDLDVDAVMDYFQRR